MLIKLTQLDTKLPLVVNISAFGQEEINVKDFDWNTPGPCPGRVVTFVEGTHGGRYYVEESYELIEAHMASITGVATLSQKRHEDGSVRTVYTYVQASTSPSGEGSLV